MAALVVSIGAPLAACSSDDEKPTPDPAPVELKSCPFPGKLPFTTQTTSFATQDAIDAVKEQPSAVYDSEDVLGNPGVAQVLTGVMKRASSPLLIQVPIAGEAVSLWTHDGSSDWRQLGRTTTDDTAAFSLDIGSTFGKGASRAYSVLEGDGSCAVHGVFQWPAGTQIVITDLDGTLTLNDEEFQKQVTNDASYDPALMPHGDDVMRAWSAKGYKIVYLTARPNALRGPSRAWMEAKGMPFGPLITNTSLSLGEDATRAYKSERTKALIATYGWKVVAAYGNAKTDYEAYADAGIATDITFIVGPLAGQGGTVAIENMDYAAHLADHVARQPDAQQP